MSSERFYRGGERSPFKVSFTSGGLSAGPSRSRANLIAVPNGTQERIKRVSVLYTVQKSTTRKAGWIAFLRVANEAVVDIAAIDMGDPTVLRPKVFVSNADHAIYENLYLEAINMDGGEALFLLAFGDSATSINYAAKWYSEASFR